MTGSRRDASAGQVAPGRRARCTSLHETFLRSRTQELGEDHCFICGRHIPKGSPQRTKDHVFPRWLLKEMGVWRSGVTTIAGRRIGYRTMTAPCCQVCNGIDFGMVEGRVRDAYHGGADAFAALDRRDLFLWLGKIAYGLAYVERGLAGEARTKDDGRIREPLRGLELLHLLLQAASGAVTWSPPVPGPASLHVIECLDDDPERRFEHLDDPRVPIIGLRIGPIGVVGVLTDWGASERARSPRRDAASETAPGPAQFRELYGRLAADAASRGATSYEVVSGDVVTVRATARG
jgi:hypothetical protein